MMASAKKPASFFVERGQIVILKIKNEVADCDPTGVCPFGNILLNLHWIGVGLTYIIASFCRL